MHRELISTAALGRLAALLALLALLVAAAAPESAPAVSSVPKDAVKKLRRAPCPPNYAVRVSRPAEPAEIRAAKRGNFDIEGVDVHFGKNFDWTFDPLDSAQFRGRLHDLRYLDILFQAYRENKDEGALRRALRIAVDWVQSNPLRKPTTDRTWFDKVVGDRGPYIAYALRAAACEGLLKSSGQARMLLGSVLQHMRFLLDRKLYSPTNRGLFMDLGLIFSGRQVSFLPEAAKARNRGQRRFVQNVNSHVIPGEGMWLEHSSQYQFLTVGAIERYLEVDKKKRPGLEALLQTMMETAAWMTLPDRRQLQNGNSFGEKADRYAQQISKEQSGMRVLVRSGIAFVRVEKSYLAFLSNYHSEIHRHSDDLSFDLYDRGHRIVSDTGIPDKDIGTPYNFAISNSAHSIVEVDGGEFPRDAAHAYGSGIVASGEGDGWYALQARNPLVGAQGAAHDRLLLFKPGDALIVADRLRSGSNHSYRSHFQFGPDFDIEEGPERIQLLSEDDRVDVFNESTDPGLTRKLARGEEDPLFGYVWEDFRDRQARWVASTVAEGADVDNVTTFSIDRFKEFRASAVGPLGDTSEYTITRNGEPSITLTVERQDDRLVVSETAVP